MINSLFQVRKIYLHFLISVMGLLNYIKKKLLPNFVHDEDLKLNLTHLTL